jgi:hypothetical protein
MALTGAPYLGVVGVRWDMETMLGRSAKDVGELLIPFGHSIAHLATNVDSNDFDLITLE